MLDWLINIDKELLLLCNSVHTSWLDNFFWMISARWLNIFVAIPFIIILIHRRAKLEAVIIILALALTVLLCDQIASSVFKPIFHRLRPTHEPSLTVYTVNGYTGGRYGFISSHAANAFGVAVLLLHIFRNKYFSITILSWAAIVGFSRIFLGVHYPGDVICGAVVGIIIGYAVYRLYDKLRVYMCKKGRLPALQNPYALNGYALFFTFSIIAVIFVIALLACL